MASLMDDPALKRAIWANAISNVGQNIGSALMQLGSRGRIAPSGGGTAIDPMAIYKVQAMQEAARQQQAQREAFNRLISGPSPAAFAAAQPGPQPGSAEGSPAGLMPPQGGLLSGYEAQVARALGPDHPVTESILLKRFEQPKEVPQYGDVQFDDQVGKFYQVNPKTGKREYVSPVTGMDITLPDGTKIGTGVPRGGAGVPGVSKSTGTKIEQKVLDYGDTMARLRSIRQRYKPEFQRIGARWNALETAWKDKLGMDVDPADKAALADYTAYVAEAGESFALTLNELSGVAVNPEEYARAERFMPNPGTPGLWGIITGDGDSPTQLESKLQRQEEFTQRALMKYQYIQYNGLTMDDVDLDDMPKLMNEKGDKLFAEYKKTMPEAEAMAKTKADLAAEFGIGIF